MVLGFGILIIIKGEYDVNPLKGSLPINQWP